MNCKPGDLAVCVSGDPRWIGVIATCESVTHEFDEPCWIVRPKVVDPIDDREIVFCDADMRPIRPPKEQDEVSEVRELENA